MEPREIRDKYNEQQNDFVRLKNEAYKIIHRELKRRGIAFHHIESRIKDLDSIITNAENKGIDNPFLRMTDIVGLRIVYRLKKELSIIKSIIHNYFRVIKEDEKPLKIPVKVFEYDALHFDVKLKNTSDDDIKDMTFEIQVHTIGQNAWAAISHPFYKGKVEISSYLEKDLYALNGLFYVADSHVEYINQNKV
ncbi:MAG: RelA/SpoT domain-containing protein [Sedimentisphaerales bacterium]|nr:RelA/SpoT domain-containing protein [Sedimentisphaerales bacterium]